VARLNPNQGAEVGKVRPVVVIQADALTEAGLATLVVVPLTSQRRRGADALRVPIPARDRLLRECWAMAEQPRALDRNRIGEGPLTRLRARVDWHGSCWRQRAGESRVHGPAPRSKGSLDLPSRGATAWRIRPEGTKNSRPLCGITTLLIGRASL
jgi:mRNA interferase MazF